MHYFVPLIPWPPPNEDQKQAPREQHNPDKRIPIGPTDV